MVERGMIEHREWVGSDYCSKGLSNQRIAISGYSHWGSEESPGFTEMVISKVCAGDGHAFFSAIRSFFDYDDDRTFWNRVVFFNTVPSLIGVAQERYSYGTEEQLVPVQARVLRIIEDHRPDKLIVFTRKGWKLWPTFSGSQTSEKTHFIGPAQDVEWGTYRRSDGEETCAFGLRHPQFASHQQMREDVAVIVAFSASEVLAQLQSTAGS